MKAKVKAIELLNKMTTNTNDDTLIYKNKYARECALITAKEIKLAFMEIANYEKAAYWRLVEVKLEKL